MENIKKGSLLDNASANFENLPNDVTAKGNPERSPWCIWKAGVPAVMPENNYTCLRVFGVHRRVPTCVWPIFSPEEMLSAAVEEMPSSSMALTRAATCVAG